MLKILDDEIVKVLINSFFCVLTFFILFLPNNLLVLKLVGLVILSFSILLMIRYRNHKAFTFFIGILSLISVCFAISNCFFPEVYAMNWQKKLVGTEAMIICAKNYMLFLITIGIAFGFIRKDKDVSEIHQNKTNWLIVLGGTLAFLFILFFGFDRGTIGTYKPNTNALYEYAIVVLIFTLFYNKNKAIKYLLLGLAGLYCFQGLLYGDRSSAFPLLICLFLFLYKKEIKIKYIILIGLGAIFFGNAIDVFRNGADLLSLDTWTKVLKTGIHVNTISYSYYGGTQVINYAAVAMNKLQHLGDYLFSFIAGKSSQFNLTVLATNAGFANKGGGFSASYFYFWGGYLGTIIGSFIMGRIIHKIFNKKTKLSNLLAILIIAFSLRYIMYYPVAFFRTALIIPIILYFVCLHGEVVYKSILDHKKISFSKIIVDIKEYWIQLFAQLKNKLKYKPKVYIHGSFMNDNFGDYLLYDVMINLCKKINPNYEYISADVDYTYDKYNEVNRKSKLYALIFAKKIVFAGGGYFGEPNKQKLYWNIRFIYKHLLFAYLLSFTKKDYIILGVEAGPISLDISKKMLKRVFNHAKKISVRNNESKLFLEKIGVTKKIDVIPDWVLSIEKEEIIKTTSKVKSDKTKIFLHFTTKADSKNNPGMIAAIRDIIKLDQENDYKFYLVCDQKNLEKEQRAKEIASQLKDATILKYSGPWNLIADLNEADLIITDKLHVGIVGIKLEKKVISIACHKKSINFYKYIEKEENAIFLDDLKENKLREKVKRILEEDTIVKKQYFLDAKKNHQYLEQFLK